MGEWTFEEPNPIVNYGVSVDLPTPINADTLREVSALHPMLRRDLPRRMEHQAFNIQVGLGMPAPTQPQLAGIVFDYVNPDGNSSRSLTVGPVGIAYTTFSYSAWTEFWPVARRMVMTAAEVVLRAVPASSMSVTVLDRFFWSDADQPLEMAKLLRSGTKFVAANILEQTSYCHNHHGYATKIDVAGDNGASTAGIQVDNINFTIQDLPDGRKVADLLFHHKFTPQMAFDHEALFTDSLIVNGVFGFNMERLHDINKIILKNIVTDEIIEKIRGFI